MILVIIALVFNFLLYRPMLHKTLFIKSLFSSELKLKEQLLWQVGIGADHTPLPFCSSQRMDSAPCRSYPLSQAYCLVLPIRCPLPPITCPFIGSSSVSQLIAEGFHKRTIIQDSYHLLNDAAEAFKQLS